MNDVAVRIISILVIIFLVFWMVLLGTGRIRGLVFWVPLAIAAIFAYWLLPRLKNQSGSA
ncbi:MAG: hypothetical protein ACOCWQ_01920 [Nanoarchaeota archaeon]